MQGQTTSEAHQSSSRTVIQMQDIVLQLGSCVCGSTHLGKCNSTTRALNAGITMGIVTRAYMQGTTIAVGVSIGGLRLEIEMLLPSRGDLA